MKKLSHISALHSCKLIFRSLLLLAAAASYLLGRIPQTLGWTNGILGIIWCVYALEMLLRFFPSSWESMGNQKQFARNHRPTGRPVETPSAKPVLLTAAVWLAPNLIIMGLYQAGVLDAGLLLLLCLAYGVCDMICILFFCPFQSWILKNQCCGTCRIYNWDYAMMFTPLAVVPGLYSRSLIGFGLALLVQWEICYHRHPERFFASSNSSLSCAACQEKLCQHKRQLQRYLVRYRAAQQNAKSKATH